MATAGAPPFPCASCGMTFRRAIDRDRHHRTHTGELPFSCPGCLTRFARKDTLGRHLRVCRIVAGAADGQEPTDEQPTQRQSEEDRRMELLEAGLKAALEGFGSADYEAVDAAVRRVLEGPV